jgi:hypothetical protein
MIRLLLTLIPLSWGAVNDPLVVYREQAREVIKSISCGGCHTPGLATTNAKALKIYNLAAPYWTASMTDRQLTAFQRRIRTQMTTEEMKELGQSPNPPLPTAEQIRIVSQFIEKEVQQRRQVPGERFRQLQATKYPEFYKAFASGL